MGQTGVMSHWPFNLDLILRSVKYVFSYSERGKISRTFIAKAENRKFT